MDSSTSRRYAGLFLALIFGAIYLLWATKNYYWDGIAFAVEAQHVTDVGLRDASDLDVWDYASARDLILVSEDYPYLERDDILASIEYAARQIDHPVLQSA